MRDFNSSRIHFKPSSPLTVGVELELQLVDPETFSLKSVSANILKTLGPKSWLQPELLQGMIEITSQPRKNVNEIHHDLRQSLLLLSETAARFGAVLACAGTHPAAKHWEQDPLPIQRYRDLIDRNQFVARRLLIFGMHVHIGTESGELCIALMNEMLHDLPLFLALSASSPYWEGQDTGLSSVRSTVFETIPTGGHPCPIADWYDFQELAFKLIWSGAIRSVKDIWWDLRPSPGYGTLEIRVCDGSPTLTQNMDIAALIHATAAEAYGRILNGKSRPAPPEWRVRENKWRAARHGVHAEVVIDDGGNVKSLELVYEDMVERLETQIRKYDYSAHISRLRQLISAGGEDTRQREMVQSSGQLSAVTAYQVYGLRKDLQAEIPRPLKERNLYG